MADTAPPGPPPTSAVPPSRAPTPPTIPRPPSRWLSAAALVVALAALVVAIIGWFRPAPAPPPDEPTFTEQQVADAKVRVCEAFALVDKGVTLQTGGGEQGGVSNEPTMAEAQAANARLSIVAGAWYLRDHVDPATPPPLATAVQHLSAILLDLGANYLAGAKDAEPAMAALLRDGESAFQQVEGLCK